MKRKELKKALTEATHWEDNLTDYQKCDIPYAEARKEKVKEILDKYCVNKKAHSKLITKLKKGLKGNFLVGYEGTVIYIGGIKGGIYVDWYDYEFNKKVLRKFAKEILSSNDYTNVDVKTRREYLKLGELIFKVLK